MGDIISSSASDSSRDRMGDESNTTASQGSNTSQEGEAFESPSSARMIHKELGELFSENIAAKIWKVAATVLEQQVRRFPLFPFGVGYNISLN